MKGEVRNDIVGKVDRGVLSLKWLTVQRQSAWQRAMKCNKPKRTPDHKTKSHVVKACKDGGEKIIRFGQHVSKVQVKIQNRKRKGSQGFLLRQAQCSRLKT